MMMEACFKWIACIGLICISVGPPRREQTVLGERANLAEAAAEDALRRRHHQVRPVVQQVGRRQRLEHAHLLLMMVFLGAASVVVFSTLNGVVIIGLHCGPLMAPVFTLPPSVARPLRLLVHRRLLPAQVERGHRSVRGALSCLIVSQ